MGGRAVGAVWLLAGAAAPRRAGPRFGLDWGWLRPRPSHRAPRRTAGCLPTLATIPIFIGLYRSLSDSAASGVFDNQGFYWVPSLAGPTTLAAQKAGGRARGAGRGGTARCAAHGGTARLGAAFRGERAGGRWPWPQQEPPLALLLGRAAGAANACCGWMLQPDEDREERAGVDMLRRSPPAGAGISWLYPCVDGAPPLGWELAGAYCILPGLVVVSALLV